MDQNQYRQYDTAAKMVTPKMPKIPFQVREAINVLRGNIQLSGADLKTIAVTSSLAHEGKSSIAFLLAKSLAGLDKKTLFVDCDIRNSVVRSRYGIEENVSGLSEFLSGQIPLLEIIYKTDDPYFDMIFTGALAPNPSELISGPLFERMLKYVRGRYDYVIVDTAPILPVIDGTLTAKQCDGTILVLASGDIGRTQAIKTKKQLEYAGIRILGAVLNRVGTKKSGYGSYGYGYGCGQTGEVQEKTSGKKKR